MCYAKPGPRCAASVTASLGEIGTKKLELNQRREKLLQKMVESAREMGDPALSLWDEMDALNREQTSLAVAETVAREEYYETRAGQNLLLKKIAECEAQGDDRKALGYRTALVEAKERRERRMAAYRQTHQGKDVAHAHTDKPRDIKKVVVVSDDMARRMGGSEENDEAQVGRSRRRNTAPAPAPRFDPTEVKDVVKGDGRIFYRRHGEVFGGTPYAIRIQANRELSPEEVTQMAQLTGYAYRSSVAGERLGNPEQDSPNSFIVAADTTKSARDDLSMALEDFEDSLPAMIKEGSPVRRTNRTGPIGTRLIEGLGDDLKVEIYYDSAWDSKTNKHLG